MSSISGVMGKAPTGPAAWVATGASECRAAFRLDGRMDSIETTDTSEAPEQAGIVDSACAVEMIVDGERSRERTMTHGVRTETVVGPVRRDVTAKGGNSRGSSQGTAVD